MPVVCTVYEQIIRCQLDIASAGVGLEGSDLVSFVLIVLSGLRAFVAEHLHSLHTISATKKFHKPAEGEVVNVAACINDYDRLQVRLGGEPWCRVVGEVVGSSRRCASPSIPHSTFESLTCVLVSQDLVSELRDELFHDGKLGEEHVSSIDPIIEQVGSHPMGLSSAGWIAPTSVIVETCLPSS